MIEKEYLLLEQTVRQDHLALDDACTERGGNSTNHRGVLAQYLDTPIYGRPIDLCHACHNAKCSNPHHLYWGSRRENVQDAMNDGKHISPWQRCVKKYGYKKACAMNGKNRDHAKAGAGNKGRTKTEEHKRKISTTTIGRKRGPYKKK